MIDKNTLAARHLLNEGVASFAEGNLVEAEQCFKESKRLASEPTPDDPTMNTARLYLATAYCANDIPGLKPEFRAANDRWFDLAEVEYREVLASNPDENERAYAEQGLKNLVIFRQPIQI